MNGVPLSISMAHRPDHRIGRFGRLRDLMHRLWIMSVCGYRRHRQRRALARLDERLLRDIGVKPEQARAESAKPFWRA